MQPATSTQVGDSSQECSICHMVVDYVRVALANKETAAQVEQVRLSFPGSLCRQSPCRLTLSMPMETVPVPPDTVNATDSPRVT